MSYAARRTLFIFLDESGNLDFSPKGSKYWSLTALCTLEPVQGRDSLLHLLYSLADEGCGLECFHATEDKQVVRDQVFKCIDAIDDNFEIHTVIAEKRKAHPSLYQKWVKKKGKSVLVKDQSGFYDRICRTLLKYIFNNPRFGRSERIVVVLSSIFTKEQHSSIEGTLKTYLKEYTNIPFLIYFRQNKADINCQIADYCGWAVTIKWERQEPRSFELIRRRVRSQFPIFWNGQTNFY